MEAAFEKITKELRAFGLLYYSALLGRLTHG